jgi:cation transport regulator ChaC
MPKSRVEQFPTLARSETGGPPADTWRPPSHCRYASDVRFALKYLVPLARANAPHCQMLVTNLEGHRPTVREMGALYSAWRRGNAEQRERMVRSPKLFLKSVDSDEPMDEAAARLLNDLRSLGAIARRSERRVDEGAYRDAASSRREPARIAGWVRRFWQGSTDHRGIPGAPGRVVTLLPEPAAVCWGMAYEVAPSERSRVLANLDHREKGGYARHTVEAALKSGERVEALVYVATSDNECYLGEAPLEAIAAQIRNASGPSGPNRDYVLALAEALAEIDGHDPHVEAIAQLLLEHGGTDDSLG